VITDVMENVIKMMKFDWNEKSQSQKRVNKSG